VARSPAKVSVECPHCGFKQLEYAAAKSTLCRQCGKHFLVAQESVEPKPAFDLGAGVSAAQSFLNRIGAAWHRPRITAVSCFECGTTQELNSAATSTICPSCSVHMDLRDYRINTTFTRAVRTHGSIYVTSSGDLSSSSVVCRTAIIEGKLRGSLRCAEKLEFRAAAKVQGKVAAGLVIIGKKADVQFFRQVQVGAIEIRGRMAGEIAAETTVTIRRTGSLDGNVTARAINVEKGGRFTGQLAIGRKSYKQGELLPDFENSKPSPAGRVRRPPPHPFGLPATS
jgi:cytoskeletal protein CcmA (bactofilin family)/DNA-directed RNA polymerase subunit RPC12/RpoP